MSVTKRVKAQFKVGDWVAFRYGVRYVVAQIIEDRGPISVHHRRLYRIRTFDEFGQPDSFELPEEELEPASDPDTPAIVKFLKEGGLTSILRTNLGGGHPPPRIHFAHSRSGGVTYTFQGPPELIRGTPPVPFLALHDGKKVFTPKKEEVVDYLTQLGLSKAEAEDVIRAVGTAP